MKKILYFLLGLGVFLWFFEEILVFTKVVVGGLVAIIVLGFILDLLMKDRYKSVRMGYRTGNGVGGGEECYTSYWIWQPFRKRFLKEMLRQEGVSGVYQSKISKNPLSFFRREIFGIIN